jgi:hypothetical protein
MTTRATITASTLRPTDRRGIPHHIRVTEGNSTGRPWFGSYPSKAAAFRAAKEALGGCRKGEGRVEVYDVNPREVDADPIKTFRA